MVYLPYPAVPITMDAKMSCSARIMYSSVLLSGIITAIMVCWPTYGYW
jgi:hypothetical protein